MEKVKWGMQKRIQREDEREFISGEGWPQTKGKRLR